jgi:hypothetical protein
MNVQIFIYFWEGFIRKNQQQSTFLNLSCFPALSLLIACFKRPE